jgi:hypothetical protein
MLDKAMWALLHRKVDHATLVETNEITYRRPSNDGARYTEYVFEVTSFVLTQEPNHICYVRIWLRNIEQKRDLRIEKVTITSPKAVLLGEWDGTRGNNDSFEVFIRGINRAAWQFLIELIPTQPQIFPNRTPSVQLATMIPEMVIKQWTEDTLVVQAVDFVMYERPVAELVLHGTDGWYWAETITLFESVSGSLPTARTHHYSENLWSNDYKEMNWE